MRLSDETVRAKYNILRQKFEEPTFSLDEFDSATYRVLTRYQTGLQQTRKRLDSGELSPDSKVAFNTAAEAFNGALSSWLGWRNLSQGVLKGDQEQARKKAETDLDNLDAAVKTMTATLT